MLPPGTLLRPPVGAIRRRHFTKMSLSGLSQCYTKLQKMQGYSFVNKNASAGDLFDERQSRARAAAHGHRLRRLSHGGR